MSKERQYGAIEPTTLENVLGNLDARIEIVLWVLRSHSNTFKDIGNENDSKVVFSGLAYHLFGKADLLKYEVEYLNFGCTRVVVVVKPKSYMEDAEKYEEHDICL